MAFAVVRRGRDAAGPRVVEDDRGVHRMEELKQWFSRGVRRARGQRLGLGYIIQRIRRMHPVRQGLSLALLVGLLAMPVLAAASAYQDYLQLRSLGTDAVHHLLAAKEALLPSTSSSGAGCSLTGTASPSASPTAHPAPTATPGSTGGNASAGASLPDAAHVATAQRELGLAQKEFGQLAVILDRPNPTLTLAGGVPSLGTKVTSVRQLVFVGQDVATMGLDLLGAVAPVLANLRGGALSDGTTPLITAPQATQLRDALARSVPMLNDLEARISAIDPNELPVSACQRAEYKHLTAELPKVNGLLAKAPQLFDAAMWFAGVDHPRQFLVQTMDTTELRPTGGFTGQYGVLTASGGRVQMTPLHDVGYIDYNPGFSYTAGRRPPSVYDWWPFPNWGLRDSNLSPDFPTTAQLVLQGFVGESGPAFLQLPSSQMDGVIALTPTPIAHVLLVTGPLQVPDYGETITAANLVDKIHYYQNDPAAIAKQNAICPASSDNSPHTKRKCFTQLVAKLVLDRVRHMSLSQLRQLATILLDDVKDKEIQVYLSNPQYEGLLANYGYASHLTTAPGQDSLMIDQANVSVSKATPYINVTMSDNVVLDAKGGATHHLLITFVNQVDSHFVDGFTTYRDYVRIYVPQQATLLAANGFDTGQPVCWIAPPTHPDEQKPARFAALATCDTGSGFFPDGSLACPQGYWGPGPRSYDAFGGDGHTDMPVENTGWPPNVTSDVAGRAMFGGFVVVPNMCTARLTLTWHVPNVALPSAEVPKNVPGYTLVVERQLSTDIPITINVKPDASVTSMLNRPIQFKGTLDSDKLFTIPRVDTRFGGP